MIKRRSLKFIGSTAACSVWLPFAVRKAVYLDKRLGSKYSMSSNTGLDGGGFVKVTVTQKEHLFIIKASEGDYIFAGVRHTPPGGSVIYNLTSTLMTTIRKPLEDPAEPENAEDLPFVLEEHPFFVEMEPVYIPPSWWNIYFPDYTHGQGLLTWLANRFDWYNDNFIIMGGAGHRYWRTALSSWLNPITPSAVEENILAESALQEMIPTIFSHGGVPQGAGPTGSECIAAAFWNGWMFAVTLRGVLKYWKLGSDEFKTIQLPLPSWINETVDYRRSTDGVCKVNTYYRAWGNGDDGIQWNFSPGGTALIGNINYLREQRVFPGSCYGLDGTELSSYCLPWTIYLQPEVSLTGDDLVFDFLHTSDQIGSLGPIAADWLWTPDALDGETVLFYLKREEYHDTGSTLSPISSPHTAPHQGDLFQNDFLVMQRSGPSSDIRLFATLRRTEYQNMFETPGDGGGRINLIENTVGDIFIHRCIYGFDIFYDLRYQAYIHGAVHHKDSSSEITAIEGASYFDDNLNKTSYNYVKLAANVELQATPIVHENDHRLSNSYAIASQTYFEGTLSSFPEAPTSLYHYIQNGYFGMASYPTSGLAVQIIKTTEDTYKYRLAGMVVYNLYADSTLSLELDVIDIDGVITEHKVAGITFGYVPVPMIDNDYEYHMSTRATFCSYNYFLGERFSPTGEI